MLTSQKQVRKEFWLAHPHCERRPGTQNDQPTDTRVAFCDFVEYLRTSGEISEELAQRVTL